jgi:hypothetical protein
MMRACASSFRVASASSLGDVPYAMIVTMAGSGVSSTPCVRGNTRLALAARSALSVYEQTALCDSALGLAKQIGDRYQQARALDGLARASIGVADPAKARSSWQDALTILPD